MRYDISVCKTSISLLLSSCTRTGIQGQHPDQLVLLVILVPKGSFPPVVSNPKVFTKLSCTLSPTPSVSYKTWADTGRMPHRDFQNELYTIGEKLLIKFQRLPKADALEIAFFLVIILFIATIIVMTSIACCYCCFNCGNVSPDPKGRKIRVEPC